MERTEILSLFKNTPADGTEITVCGWAKNIRDSKNIGFIALSDGGCFKTLQVVLEAGKLENYDAVIHTGLYSSLRIVGRIEAGDVKITNVKYVDVTEEQKFVSELSSHITESATATGAGVRQAHG